MITNKTMVRAVVLHDYFFIKYKKSDLKEIPQIAFFNVFNRATGLALPSFYRFTTELIFLGLLVKNGPDYHFNEIRIQEIKETLNTPEKELVSFLQFRLSNTNLIPQKHKGGRK